MVRFGAPEGRQWPLARLRTAESAENAEAAGVIDIARLKLLR